MMDRREVYSPDRSLKGKLRRRLARLVATRPARVTLARPMVTFSFDDAPISAAQTGAALLESRGLRGTYYIAAGLAGQAGPMGDYADSALIQNLHSRGHDIACHSFSHLDCGKAAPSRIGADIEDNARAFAAWGIKPPTGFAYPYGDVSIRAKRALGHRFALLRGLHHGIITTGTDLNQAPSVGIEGQDGEMVALDWLKRARAASGWLILYTHDVRPSPSAFGCTEYVLGGLIDTALAQGFDVVTAAEGCRRIGA
jgi:peptidoglycan/xylan/chitin deacetylase (PgdA/CDA1 family)